MNQNQSDISSDTSLLDANENHLIKQSIEERFLKDKKKHIAKLLNLKQEKHKQYLQLIAINILNPFDTQSQFKNFMSFQKKVKKQNQEIQTQNDAKSVISTEEFLLSQQSKNMSDTKSRTNKFHFKKKVARQISEVLNESHLSNDEYKKRSYDLESEVDLQGEYYNNRKLSYNSFVLDEIEESENKIQLINYKKQIDKIMIKNHPPINDQMDMDILNRTHRLRRRKSCSCLKCGIQDRKSKQFDSQCQNYEVKMSDNVKVKVKQMKALRRFSLLNTYKGQQKFEQTTQSNPILSVTKSERFNETHQKQYREFQKKLKSIQPKYNKLSESKVPDVSKFDMSPITHKPSLSFKKSQSPKRQLKNLKTPSYAENLLKKNIKQRTYSQVVLNSQQGGSFADSLFNSELNSPVKARSNSQQFKLKLLNQEQATQQNQQMYLQNSMRRNNSMGSINETQPGQTRSKNQYQILSNSSQRAKLMFKDKNDAFGTPVKNDQFLQNSLLQKSSFHNTSDFAGNLSSLSNKKILEDIQRQKIHKIYNQESKYLFKKKQMDQLIKLNDSKEKFKLPVLHNQVQKNNTKFNQEK